MEFLNDFREFCQIDNQKKILKQKFPIITWLPKYRFKDLQGDIISGLTVGLTVIPQGLALASVADLPPQYGLYTSFMGCFIYCMFGTSKDITIGPTAIMSLLIATFARSPKPRDATLAIILTMSTGLIQLIMGLLGIGFVMDFISYPVIDSFTTAAAITIAEGQVKNWFGLKNIPRDFIHEIYWTLRKLPETKIWDFSMGLFCLCLLICLKYMTRLKCLAILNPSSRLFKILNYIIWLISTGRNALVVLLAASIVAIFSSYNIQPFSVTGNVQNGIPNFHFPNFTLEYNGHVYPPTELFKDIGVGFVIIPLLGLVESLAIGKVFSRRNGYTINASQEFVALGLCNFFSCFLSSYPVTGSFSRTAVNSESGSRTPANGIFTGILVLLALQFLTPYFCLIPNAALAVIIIMAVSDMISFKLIYKLWKIKKLDLFFWIATFLSSLILGVEWGILIGIGLSLILLLWTWGRPNITDTTNEALQFIHMTSPYNCSRPDIIVFSVSHGLSFPGLKKFVDFITIRVFTKDLMVRSAILDCSHLGYLDYTSAEGLRSLMDDFERHESVLVLCMIQPSLLEMLEGINEKCIYTAKNFDEAVRKIIAFHEQLHDEDTNLLQPIL